MHLFTSKLRSVNLPTIRKRAEYGDLMMSDIGYEINPNQPLDLATVYDKYLCVERTTDIDIVAGMPSRFGALFFHSEEQQMYHRHCLYQILYAYTALVPDISITQIMNAFYEVLCKGLVYKELKRDTVIFVHPTLAYYVKSAISTGYGMTCAWLSIVPGSVRTSDEIPDNIVCVCGSKFHPAGLDALSSYKSDFDYTIGLEAFLSAREQLDHLFDDIYDTKIVVCGHSLGGALAQIISAHFEVVGHCITFSSPGVPDFIHGVFGKRTTTLRVDIHVTDGDFVFRAGGIHIGYHDRSVSRLFLYRIDKTLYLRMHTYLCISNPLRYPVSVVTSTSKESIASLYITPLEFMRFSCACVLSPFFYLLRRTVRSVVPSRVSLQKTSLLDVWTPD